MRNRFLHVDFMHGPSNMAFLAFIPQKLKSAAKILKNEEKMKRKKMSIKTVLRTCWIVIVWRKD